MANVLMINVPYAGHTNPTLPLAGDLVNALTRYSWYSLTPDRTVERMEDPYIILSIVTETPAAYKEQVAALLKDAEAAKHITVDYFVPSSISGINPDSARTP